MSEAAALPEDDYIQLEMFIARTARGRAFLEEHARRSRTMGIDEVKAVVDALRSTWERHEEVVSTARHIEVLRRELQDMSASIVQARREIAAIRPKDEGDDRISTAANELDAIVLSTERASIEILSAAERIMEVSGPIRQAGGSPAHCDILDAEVMNIFTACSFQDLTGQRTTKVVNALRYIEQRIMALMSLWGVEGGTNDEIPEGPVDTRPDAHLLNGPSDDGIDQTDIDRLLNGDDFTPAPKAEAAPKKAAKPTPPPESEAEAFNPLNQNSIDALFG